MARGKGTGKPCGASYIERSKRCTITLPTAVNKVLHAATGEIGAASLKEAVVKHAGPQGLQRLREIRAAVRGEMGGNIVKGPKADEMKRRLQAEGLLPGRALSMPTDLKRQLNALAAQEPEKKPTMQEWQPVLATQSTPIKSQSKATGNTTWARGDAEEFDYAFNPLRTVKGTADMIDWAETVKQGKKIGEGGYGTVMMAPRRDYVVKRGEVSDTEAELIKRVGEADLGPKLIVGQLGKETGRGQGVVMRDGRVAMTVVPGEPIGQKGAAYVVGGVKVSDAYWTARAQLHRMGIAHNDMHIDNVLIDDKGKGRFVDMGLAQASPKAALAEAIGAFSPLTKNATPQWIEGQGGRGDWQARRWDGTGGELLDNYERQSQFGGAVRAAQERLERDAPLLARVHENKNALQYRLQKDGFTRDEIATIQTHGIRSDLDSYNKGPWSRMTDEQAMNYINILYDGV